MAKKEKNSKDEKSLQEIKNKEVSTTTGKEVRTFPAKKLPGILKKSYSEKKFNKKLLKKIYIAEDKALIEKLFVKGANPKKPDFFAVPQDLVFTKKELARYKMLAKEIKSQKGRVKLVPLIAVVVAIFALVFVVTTFKNPLVKKALIAGGEAAFGAKTEISSVDFKIFGASLTVKGLAVGNKNSVMRNLFEIQTIDLDFNLVQALRGKFDAENLEVSGMAFNTKRTTSCALPEKKKKEKSESEESEFVKSLKSKSQTALSDLEKMAADILGGTDPESIVENLLSQIHTPDAALEAQKKAEALITKYQQKPAELEQTVNTFATSVQEFQNFNVNAFNVKSPEDLKTLKAELEKINNTIQLGIELKDTMEDVVDEVHQDAVGVQKIALEIKDAAESDINFATKTVHNMVDTVKNADKLFETALDTVGYDMLGKYYPYVQQGIGYAVQLKENAGSSEKPKKEKSKKEKKQTRERLAGTTFWYTKQNPAFLIEHVLASGENFKAEISEITNDQDVRNKPMNISGFFSYSGVDHNASLVVDARSKSTAPLISADYTGSGFQTSIDGGKIAVKSGVPSVKGVTTISLSGTAGSSGFTAGGNLSINPLTLSSDGFENEIISKYYNVALASVSNLKMGYKVGYQTNSGVFLNLDGNFADQFVTALRAVILSIGNDAKEAALEQINALLNSSTNEVMVKTREFLGIEEEINVQDMRLSDLQKILDKKRSELENYISSAAEQAVNQVETQVVNTVSDAVKQATGGNQDAANAASDLTKKATNALKGLFGN